MGDVRNGSGATRLLLEAGPWMIDDRLDRTAGLAFARWASDPVLAGSLNRAAEALSEGAVAAIAGRHDGRTSWLAFVRVRADARPLGYISLIVDPMSGVGRLELVVGDPSQASLAFMDEVASALGRWCFETMAMRKISFAIRADNRVTARWLDRNAVLEGRLRGEIVLPDGRVVDQLLYGMLPEEWRVLRDRLDGGSDAPARLRSRSSGRGVAGRGLGVA